MTRNLSITLGLLLVLALGFGVFSIVRSATGGGEGEQQRVSQELLVSEDSHYLERNEDAAVTVVEYLDFECPACGAQYPVMEEMRDTYGDQINFVVRYFPLDGHVNARTTAAAAEAAARQDSFEEMYAKLFETQQEWSGASEPTPDVFGDAEALGLDVEQFTEDMESEEVQQRVQADMDDGMQAGVQGTPSIYVNGLPTSSQPTAKQLGDLIEKEMDQ